MSVLGELADDGAVLCIASFGVSVFFTAAVVDGSGLNSRSYSSFGSDQAFLGVSVLSELTDNGAVLCIASFGVSMFFTAAVVDGNGGGFNSSFGRCFFDAQQITANVAVGAVVFNKVPGRAADIHREKNADSGAGFNDGAQQFAFNIGVTAHVDLLERSAADGAFCQGRLFGDRLRLCRIVQLSFFLFFCALGKQTGVAVTNDGYIRQLIFAAHDGIAGVAFNGVHHTVFHVFDKTYVLRIGFAFVIDENQIAAGGQIRVFINDERFVVFGSSGVFSVIRFFISADGLQLSLPGGAAGVNRIVGSGNIGIVQTEGHEHGAPILIGSAIPVTISGVVTDPAAFIHDKAIFVFAIANLRACNGQNIGYPVIRQGDIADGRLPNRSRLGEALGNNHAGGCLRLLAAGIGNNYLGSVRSAIDRGAAEGNVSGSAQGDAFLCIERVRAENVQGNIIVAQTAANGRVGTDGTAAHSHIGRGYADADNQRIRHRRRGRSHRCFGRGGRLKAGFDRRKHGSFRGGGRLGSGSLRSFWGDGRLGSGSLRSFRGGGRLSGRSFCSFRGGGGLGGRSLGCFRFLGRLGSGSHGCFGFLGRLGSGSLGGFGFFSRLGSGGLGCFGFLSRLGGRLGNRRLSCFGFLGRLGSRSLGCFGLGSGRFGSFGNRSGFRNRSRGFCGCCGGRLSSNGRRCGSGRFGDHRRGRGGRRLGRCSGHNRFAYDQRFNNRKSVVAGGCVGVRHGGFNGCIRKDRLRRKHSGIFFGQGDCIPYGC